MFYHSELADFFLSPSVVCMYVYKYLYMCGWTYVKVEVDVRSLPYSLSSLSAETGSPSSPQNSQAAYSETPMSAFRDCNCRHAISFACALEIQTPILFLACQVLYLLHVPSQQLPFVTP